MGNTKEVHSILIIEDDPDIRESLKDILELEGYTVTTAENGQDGLEKLRQSPPPDLVLLDLFMPVMDGIQFLDELKSRSPNAVISLPVVVVSAAPPEDKRLQSRKSFVSGFIKKPVNVDLLLNMIHQSTEAA
jgi:CheY-like chemotaxis protein